MFERFTRRARSVIAHTQNEAVALGHNFLGTEHILLGLTREAEGVAARVLTKSGVGYEDVRREVVTMIGLGEGASGLRDAEALATIGIDLEAVTAAVEDAFGPGALDQPRQAKQRQGKTPEFVPRAKKLMEIALREAKTLDHNYIGTEHLLLAILRLHEGVAFAVLELLTPPADKLRDAVMQELQQLQRGA